MLNNVTSNGEFPIKTKMIFMWLSVALPLCLLITSNVMAGELEDKLMRASCGDVVAIKSLLNKGARVNWKEDQRGNTPLLEATNCRSTDNVRFLIDNGADVNMKNNYGVTPLMNAASHGHADVVKLLLDKGADVNAKTTDTGETALAISAKNKKAAIELGMKGAEVFDEINRMLKGAEAK